MAMRALEMFGHHPFDYELSPDRERDIGIGWVKDFQPGHENSMNS
jgi:hypothetical protein